MTLTLCLLTAVLSQAAETKSPEAERLEQLQAFLRAGQGAVKEREHGPVVARGFRWLAAHQHFDGGWSLATGPTKPFGYPNPGATESRMAATSLALLVYLGAGNLPDQGRHKVLVSDGVDFLASQLRLDGQRVDARGDGDLWSHTLATLVLCQLAEMSPNTKYREPARAATAQLLTLQDEQTGGWRRAAGQPSELETSMWAVLALHSGKLARVAQPQESFALAGRFLDGQRHAETELFRDGAGERTPLANSLGLVARIYSAWPEDRAPLRKSVQHVLDHKTAPHDALFDLATTLATHQLEGEDWKAWNASFRERLIRDQLPDGSWHDPEDRAGAARGRLYQTVLRLLALETYYRHLPIFRKESVARGAK